VGRKCCINGRSLLELRSAFHHDQIVRNEFLLVAMKRKVKARSLSRFCIVSWVFLGRAVRHDGPEVEPIGVGPFRHVDNPVTSESDAWEVRAPQPGRTRLQSWAVFAIALEP